jgi:hypothetical protein
VELATGSNGRIGFPTVLMPSDRRARDGLKVQDVEVASCECHRECDRAATDERFDVGRKAGLPIESGENEPCI